MMTQRTALFMRFLVLLPLFLSTYTFASRGGVPEFFFQPGPASIALDGEFHQITSPAKTEVLTLAGVKSADSETEFSGFAGKVHLGLFSDWALFASAHWLKQSLELTAVGFTTPTTEINKGMSDVTLGIKKLNQYGGLGIPMSVGTIMSQDDYKEASATKDGNNQSGGNDLFASLGLFMNLPNAIIGADGNYRKRGKRTISDQGEPEVKSKAEDGDQLALSGFFEFNLGPANLDLFGSQTKIDDSKNTDSSGTETTDKGYTYTTFGAGFQSQLTPMFNLRVQYEHFMMPKIEYDTYQTAKFSYGDFSARLRIEF